MSKINNYEELMVERRKLEEDLSSQKAYLKTEFNALKEKYEPLTRIISLISGLKNNPGNALMKLGSSVGIELLVRQKLAKAGWLAKLILPFLLKFTASKTIDTVQQKITRGTALNNQP